MKEKKLKRVFRSILTALALLLYAAVLELGRHTLTGWILAAVILLLFFIFRRKMPADAKLLPRLASCMLLLLLLAGVLRLSRPPVRPVPAVEGKSAGVTDVVHIAQGDLTGVLTEDGSVEVFTGIPYAKPPVGELRWREPQEPEPWEGVLAADHFAPMSMQTQDSVLYSSLARIVGYHDYKITLKDNYRAPVSEDSLYLNIWKPAGGKKDLPVLVYIHGGSLQTGQPWYEDYRGETLAKNDVIVVNMAYRLGIFGFFADEALAAESPNGTTGNYGLLDQIQSLRWVQENIAAFGGDPENVTIAGESAGSACVTALCTSPLAKGLFRRAVAESSTVTAPEPAHSFRLLPDAFSAGAKTKEKFGALTVEELRALPAEEIVSELSAHHHITVDGYVLTKTPWESYKAGEHNEEALMHGYNKEESAPFILFSQADLKNYEKRIRAFFPSPYDDEVLSLYPAATDEEARRNWADIYSVVFFSYGHYCLTRQALKNEIPSYVYFFTKENGRLGTWHSGEEVYLYGNIPDDSKLYDETDRALSDAWVKYYVNFIRTGEPNGEGLPEWPESSGDGTVQNLGDTIGQVPAPYTPLHEIFDRMYGAI